jgi:hypothetical protein
LKALFENICKRVKQLWVWLLKKDLIIFLLFVGLTTIFWWGRTMSSPRDMVVAIPLVYNGLGQKVVCEQALPETLRVTIRDNGEQLRKIKTNNIHLDYDIRPLVDEKDGVLTLSAEQLRPKIQDLLPGSTKIQRITPENFSSKFYVQADKVVPVEVVSDIQMATQYQMVGKASATPDSIVLFGSQEALDTIRLVKTKTVRAAQLRENIKETVQLELPKGVQAAQQTVDVVVNTEQFTEKTMTLPIKVKDIPEGMNIRLFPQSAELTLRVGISHFADIDASDIEVYCQYPTHSAAALDVYVACSNPNITHLRISPDKVEYIINK